MFKIKNNENDRIKSFELILHGKGVNIIKTERDYNVNVDVIEITIPKEDYNNAETINVAFNVTYYSGGKQSVTSTNFNPHLLDLTISTRGKGKALRINVSNSQPDSKSKVILDKYYLEIQQAVADFMKANPIHIDYDKITVNADLSPYAKVEDFMTIVDNYEDMIPVKTYVDKYVGKNGVLSNNNGDTFYAYEFEVAPNDVIKVSSSWGYNTRLWALYDESMNLIESYPSAEADKGGAVKDEAQTLLIPQGGAFLRVGYTIRPCSVKKKNGTKGGRVLVDHIDDKLTDMFEYGFTELVDLGDKLEGYPTVTGGVNKTSGYYHRDIDVIEGEQLLIKSGYRAYVAAYTFFNNKNKLVEVYPNEKTTQKDVGGQYPVDSFCEIITVPIGAVKLRLPESNEAIKPAVYRKSETLSIPNAQYHGNILFEKKWCVCGDGVTRGDFSKYVDENGNMGADSDAFARGDGFKTYHWYIKNRNKMTIKNVSKVGMGFTNNSNVSFPFSNSETNPYSYTEIDLSCDYLTFMFGLSETKIIKGNLIGSPTDTDNTTLWGAWNTVMEYIYTNNPFIKVGIIIPYGWLSNEYHDAMIEIAKYWGVPYLDLRDDPRTPIMLGGNHRKENGTACVGDTAYTLRHNAFRISEEASVINPKGQEYLSTIIENFLRSL